ncbi:hypothetical protein L3Q82_002790 [Scortum barcoo]|uniref:Uncharacterized protein n=1 Tax=Scortum barcoo TaxID=214431 RepID=A0ACB8VXL1_9TELE|nr:hypothetical protein L3Q82_002790 [Scortum barcoo]
MVTVTSVDIYIPPTLKVLAPSDEQSEASFSCFAKDFSPNHFKIKWLKNDVEISENFGWTPDTKVTCEFEGRGENGQYLMNSSVTNTIGPGPCSGCREADVDVKITGPKMEDLFLKQRPVIVCEVKNLRIVSPNISLYPVWEGDFRASAVRLICTISGFFPDSLSVNWQQNDQDINIPRIDTKLRSVDEAGKTFSLSSEIEPNLKQWTDGSSFTCKSIHSGREFKKTTSICQTHATTPPSIRMEIPSFKTVMEESQVKATCSVPSKFDTKLTWLIDGLPSSDKGNQVTNATHSTTTLTVPTIIWKEVKYVTCKTEHPCLPSTMETIQVSTSAPSTPSVVIRRSLLELLKGYSAVLECDVTELSSSDLYVTFQANNRDISDKFYVDLPGSPGPHSISRSFTVPSTSWINDASFTCQVNQGFLGIYKSKPISNIFVDPSVELLLAPSEESGTQRLSCTGWGFNPQIKWFAGFEERTPSTNDISMGADGLVTVTSQLHIPQQEWKTAKGFSCEVSDTSLAKKVKKDISLCSVDPSVELLLAPSEESGTQRLSCTGWGFNPQIKWFAGSEERTPSTNDISMGADGLVTVTSQLHIPQQEWKTAKGFSCEVSDTSLAKESQEGHQPLLSMFKSSSFNPCGDSQLQDINDCNISAAALTPPSVVIRRSLLELLKGYSAVLECDVTELSSSDLYITFQANNRDISEKFYVMLIFLEVQALIQSVGASLSLQAYWINDASFTCQVNQGFISIYKSKPISNIFVDPSVELLLAPSEKSGTQRLSCTGWGFNPQIKWFAGSEERTPSTNDISMGADGLVTVISQLHIPQKEWKTAKGFSCEVSDTSLAKKSQEGHQPLLSRKNMADPRRNWWQIPQHMPELVKQEESQPGPSSRPQGVGLLMPAQDPFMPGLNRLTPPPPYRPPPPLWNPFPSCQQPSEPSTSWQPGPVVEQPPPIPKNEPDHFPMFPGGCSQLLPPPRPYFSAFYSSNPRFWADSHSPYCHHPHAFHSISSARRRLTFRETHQTLLPHQTYQAYQAHLALRLKMAGVYDVLCPIAMISRLEISSLIMIINTDV